MTTHDERAEQIQRSVQARQTAQSLVQSARAAVRRGDEGRARARSARKRAEHTREREPRVPAAPLSAHPRRIEVFRFCGRVVSTSLPQG